MLDYVILNGCCNGNRSGEYTYVSPHGSSVIDYFPMSEDLFSANHNMRVGDRADSWHMPVELCWNTVAQNTEQPFAAKSQEECIAWSDEFLLTCTDELWSPDFKLCMQEAIAALSTNVDK